MKWILRTVGYDAQYLGNRKSIVPLVGVILGLMLFVRPVAAAPAIAVTNEHFVLEASIGDTLRSAGSIERYVLVFVIAAILWLELWTVIPLGIAIGMNPFGVALFGFLGNVLPVYGIIVFFVRVETWVEARRGETDTGTSRSRERTKRILNQYGLPGLAIASPFVLGVHITTFLILTMGATKRDAVLWMTISVVFWTIVITVGAYYGIEGLRSLL